MSKTFLKWSVGLLAVAGLVWPAAAAVAGKKFLSGHVPKAVSKLTPLGRLDATNEIKLAIGLPLRNPEALTNLLEQIYDPTSPNYHHFLTPDEFTAQFGPTEKDYQAVIDFAKTNGFTVTTVSPNRMLVGVKAKTATVENTFKVTLHSYHHPTENRDFYAPDQEPSVPADLPILEASGLNNFVKPHSLAKIRPASAKTTSAKNFSGTAPDGTSYMGYDYRKAYVPGTTLTGAGQKIALVQFDGYFASDIAQYQQLTGLPSISLTNILLDGFDGNPTLTGGEGEVELDIEMVNSMAPGIDQVLVYEENPAIFDPVMILNRIATDNAAKQVSCSWSLGVAPSGSGTINQILQQMALQGQSFFQASGDSDALLPGEADDLNGFFGICCNPYVTSCGGTKLITDAAGNFLYDSVWNDRTPNQGQGGDWGSGGGISTYYATPTWQQGFGNSTNHGSATGRNFPDVAFTATDLYIIVYGVGQVSGGTSAAAPLWAAFNSLINQQAAINGRAPIGFLNPSIYAIAKTAAYANCFHDTTNGDNTWPGSPTNFYAVAGYDLCTGLGTPNGNNLINALASSAAASIAISAPLQPWGANLSVFNGSNPNGNWFLFVQDDKPLDVGMINGGWSVTITTANPVGYAADNAVYAALTNMPISVGKQWAVTVAVTNYGPSVSSNVYVTDSLPLSGMTLVSNTPTLGSVSTVGTILTWNLGTLNTNAGATLNLVFNSTAAGVFTNTAVVNAGTTDPNPDDDLVSSVMTALVPTTPQMTPVAYSRAGGFSFSITGSPVLTTVQGSTNLVNWVNLYQGYPPFNYTDPAATNYLRRFYRSVVGL